MNRLFLCVFVSSCLSLGYCSIPLVTSPSWSSSSNDYSTGGGFWDIDTNGYVDFCMSNGNDMALNYNAVYFNHGGTLENTASWRSSDNGNFGHLYLGDVDNDGLTDMAVAYLGPARDHRTRIYRNIGGTLSAAPWWKSKDSTTHFDICLGDVNNDGWLDVAISAGDAYSSLTEPHKIYFNHSGVLDTLPGWQSANRVQSDGVRLADLNRDGKLDLVADGKGRLYVYYQRGDTLERSPSWTDTTGTNVMGLRIAVGDYDNDGWLDIAAVCNAQIGTGNSIRIYHNNNGVLEKPPARILQRRDMYSSCAAWGDVNGDGWLDLAAGGWWDSLVVYENRGGVLDTVASWNWRPASLNDLVCETVVWTDVRNMHVVNLDEPASGDGVRKLFYLAHMPFQEFHGVTVNGTPVPRSDYCFDALTGYVSLRNAPPVGTNNVLFSYSYSRYPDLGVTNWEPSDHNYVFYNTTASAVAEAERRSSGALRISGPSFFSGSVEFELSLSAGSGASVGVYSLDGRLVASLGTASSGRLVWSGRDACSNSVSAGLYFLKAMSRTGETLTRKLVKLD
jgi:hypothetical protein